MLSTLNTDRVAAAARCVARSFAAADPVGSLADLGIALVVRGKPLRLPGKRVRGSWDPCLRRIELHGSRAGDADCDLVRILGHEMGHALGSAWSRPSTREEEEVAADAFVRAWLAALGADRIRICAGALRDLTVSDSAVGGAEAPVERRDGILPLG